MEPSQGAIAWTCREWHAKWIGSNDWLFRVWVIPGPKSFQCTSRRRGARTMANLSGRDFVLEAIEKYRERPCLWQVTHPSYHDKIRRNKALDDFLELFRSVDPSASRETVQKKLTSIRSSFNKEQRKVKASLVSGTGSQNVHIPKLWYFDQLSFLADQDIPRQSETPSSLLDKMPFDEEEIDDLIDESRSENSQMSSATLSSTTSSNVPKCFKRPQQKADAILERIAKRMEQPIETSAQNPIRQPHDAFGQHIAEKLRSLPPSMVPLCEKLINEALFLAEFEQLNVNSKIITDHNYFPPSTGCQPPPSATR